MSAPNPPKPLAPRTQDFLDALCWVLGTEGAFVLGGALVGAVVSAEAGAVDLLYGLMMLFAGGGVLVGLPFSLVVLYWRLRR